MLKKRIYVADDDPAILEIITMILEEEGFEVETSVDGKSLQDTLRIFPDLVLLDIRMSGSDGGEICRTLKSKVATQNIPVILVSANKDINIIAENCLANDFLPKPFEINDLLMLTRKYTV